LVKFFRDRYGFPIARSRCAELGFRIAVAVADRKNGAWGTRKEQMMRGKLAITAAAMLLAGTFATAAQQSSKQPQEPKGEDSSRSATPNSQQPGPDQTRGQGNVQGGGQGSMGKQQTPQEPRGEESERSSTPRSQQK